MRPVTIVAIALLVLLGGCGGESQDSGASTDATPKSATNAASEPIVGEWQRRTACEELVQALRDAGMDELVAEFVAGNGFIPGVGVEDPERVDPEQPCKGAVPRVHSHFFTAEGEFGSRDWNGQDVDDGRWRVSGDRLIISKEFPEVTFRYSIDRGALTFEPLDIPAGCTSFRCGWSIAVAYPGKRWTRVR